MTDERLDMISEVGSVLVAVIVTGGLVLLQVLGKPTDGLEPGMLAIIAFYFGGQLTKSVSSRSLGKASTLAALSPSPPKTAETAVPSDETHA